MQQGNVVTTIFAYVKLFEKMEYAEDFVNGKLFMNTIRSFKEYRDESGELRGDEYEGIVAMYQPNKISEIKFGDHLIPPSDLASPLVIQGDHILDQNVFCIYSLNSSGHDSVSSDTLAEFRRTLELHETCFGLGKYCVVIRNASEFISRCTSAIKKLNVDGSLGLVEYFNEHEFHGKMPDDKLGYQKRSFFKHQREYRVKIDTRRANPKPYILDIGDLTDISSISTPKVFNESLTIKLPDGSVA
jgi:hypothetical protein